MSGPTLRSIPTERDEMQGALENLRRSMPTIIEYHRLQAKLRVEMFKEYRAAGMPVAVAVEMALAHDFGGE